MDPTKVLDDEITRVERALGQLKKARAALDGYDPSGSNGNTPRVVSAPKATRKTRTRKTPSGRRPRVSAEEAQEKIAQLLAGSEQSMTARELEAEANLNYAAVKRALAALVELGAVTQDGDNKRNA